LIHFRNIPKIQLAIFFKQACHSIEVDMHKYKIILLLLMSALMVTAAYSQEKLESNQTKTISGTVTDTNFVGSTITILTVDQQQMAFYVPENAIIAQGTKDIGLMDIKQGHSVTIQYDISSPGKNIVDSIADNNPMAEE
jgi:hypothetical protein